MDQAQKRKYQRFQPFLGLGLLGICIGFVIVSWNGPAESALAFESGFVANLENILASPAPYSLVPEYSQNLKLVVLSVSHLETDLRNHDQLIRCFPDYTEIILMVPQLREREITGALATKSYRDRVRVCSFESQLQPGGEYYLLFSDKDRLIKVALSEDDRSAHYGSLWAQDLFEASLDRDGSPVLLIPELHKFYHSVSTGSDAESNTIRVTSDNQYLQDLKQYGVMTANLPIAFMGGNVITDYVDGQRLVFVGSDVLRGTGLIWRAPDEFSPDESYIIDFLKHIFVADEIVVIGNPTRQQPDRMFHLAQAMMILKPGVACVEKIIPGTAPQLQAHPDLIHAREYLAETRATLIRMDYSIVDIEVTPESLLGYRHYANLIPYTDKNTGEPVILMPVYEDSIDSGEDGLAARNRASLEKIGFVVVPVATRANRIYGGIHCLANVIS